ncbi:hypothetical protein Tco_1112176 [Tanacetum coccineum]|uniref:Uncharacterized protein n=1 Tax=Tanacetum coccineum TaxID=301880 RepID=A0ABQ5INR5_9ASTR
MHDEYDGGVELLLGSSNKTNGRRDIFQSIQVHQGDVKEVRVGKLQTNQDADVERTMKPTPWIPLYIEKNVEQVPPYNSTLPALDDIINLIHQRTIHEKNVYLAIGNRDHTQAIIALMLYCLENGQPFNLAYFVIRRMYYFRDRRDKVLPYGMILTRLFKNLKANMAYHPFDECYILVTRKMLSLKAKQPKKLPPKRTRNVGKSKLEPFLAYKHVSRPKGDKKDVQELG